MSADLSQPENKAKQLQTLQLPIPVGEVSPVSLKRSPGPAIHSGLPSVLPIIGPGIKTQGSAASHPVVRPGLNAFDQTVIFLISLIVHIYCNMLIIDFGKIDDGPRVYVYNCILP